MAAFEKTRSGIPKKLPPIGARIIKSSVAVGLCILDSRKHDDVIVEKSCKGRENRYFHLTL